MMIIMMVLENTSLKKNESKDENHCHWKQTSVYIQDNDLLIIVGHEIWIYINEDNTNEANKIL